MSTHEAGEHRLNKAKGLFLQEYPFYKCRCINHWDKYKRSAMRAQVVAFEGAGGWTGTKLKSDINYHTPRSSG